MFIYFLGPPANAQQKGLEILLYLDNFILFEVPEGLGRNGETQQSQQCVREQALALCRKLGIPVADGKRVVPTTVLTFWGIELNTAEINVRLPMEKVMRLRRVIGEWHMKKVCMTRDLLSLIGQLKHVCCVVRVGLTFLRRTIELSVEPKELHLRV